jgi:hypothetical protein
VDVKEVTEEERPVDCIRDARQAGLNAETESGWRQIRKLQAWAQARN